MWSIIMEPGKKYSTVVDSTFHLSMAALDLETVKKGGDDVHTVYVETNGSPRIILCHLSKSSKMYQCKLDHIFTRGTDLQFVTSASANIHMTGYLDLMEDDELNSDLESLTEDEHPPASKKIETGKKRKSDDSNPKKSKSLKLNESSDDDDESIDLEDESDEGEFGVRISDLLNNEAESGEEEDEDEEEEDDDEDDEDDDDDDDDDDEDDESDEVEDEPVFTKKPQKGKQTPKKQVNGNEQKTPKKDQKSPKVQEKTPKVQNIQKQKTPEANKSLLNGNNESSKKKKDPKTPLSALKTKPDTPLPKDKQNQQQKLNGGVIIQDLKVGDGAVAKPGKIVKVYYIGRLKSTGKVFDSMQKGGGFAFGVQRGEVIKGWDIGIAGMKVGGKRKVICPPNMAYGAKGSPPEIPPNSTLVFEVELKHVN